MKFIIRIILVAIISYIAELFMPWWSVVISAFLVGVMIEAKGYSAFFSGFLGVAIFWFSFAFMIDMQNGSVLSSRVVQLFPLPPKPMMLILFTAIVGGIAGGMGSLTGNTFRRAFLRR